MTDNSLPAPPIGAEVDVRDLDGFMLNVERLMASELVALSTHEVIAAALFLWCRAWKQIPAASLPNDDRVIAAFSRLPIARFRKMRSEVLRGFFECSDGRLYHRVLAAEADRAFAKKKTFHDRREKDAERLRSWRAKQPRNSDDTPVETNNETRFVQEGQGQGRDGTGTVIKEREEAGPPLRDGNPIQPTGDAAVASPEADLYRRGREILGTTAGGLVKKLLAAKDQNVPLARSALETASTKGSPREYLGAVIAGASATDRNIGGAHSSRDM